MERDVSVRTDLFPVIYQKPNQSFILLFNVVARFLSARQPLINNPVVLLCPGPSQSHTEPYFAIRPQTPTISYLELQLSGAATSRPPDISMDRSHLHYALPQACVIASSPVPLPRTKYDPLSGHQPLSSNPSQPPHRRYPGQIV